ncbi:MAG: hypothetical protein Q9P01_04950 [Anaerolineae bacterium]|nr:hypothetical protein [Anaerolineae bacterium]MDQ7034190.1 hypothetical protein [Anaerolineae bacterium]
MTDTWQTIFDEYLIHQHDFDTEPFFITAKEIKKATNNLEPRILCKQDTRESRPQIFQENNLFILPVKNGKYAIVRGEGYVDIPPVDDKQEKHKSLLDYRLDTAHVGNSEMQYLDFAYATSLIRSVMDDDSLVLTIRGRKYTPPFSFKVGNQWLETRSVQTEVDAGYEGRSQVVLVEAKNSRTTNTIIRQLFYPYRQWTEHTDKPISSIFFEKNNDEYNIWHFVFDNPDDYNSIRLLKSGKYIITGVES